MKGTCIDPWQHVGGTKSCTIYLVPNDNEIARVAYYFVKKGWNIYDKKVKWPKNTDSNRSFRIPMAISYARVKEKFHTTKTPNQWEKEYRQQGISSKNVKRSKDLYDVALKDVGKNEVPSNFVCYLCYNKNYQDGVVWDLKPGTSIKLTKTGKHDLALEAYEDFSGIKYTLYASDKETEIDVFELNKKGTATIKNVPAGTYYAKETKTNDVYKKNTSWVGPVTITDKMIKNKTTAQLTDEDEEVYGTGKIIKKEANGQPMATGDKFTFTLTHQENPSIKYTLTLTGNGSDETEASKELPIGTYEVRETKVQSADGSQYINVTKEDTITIKADETTSINWINKWGSPQRIAVIKETSDDSPLNGFKFKVTGKIDGVKLTSEQALATAAPNLTLTYPDLYDVSA